MAKISSFEEDRFNRKKVADYITKIIENKDKIFNPEEGLVIGIDSAWGTGKTTFLDLWEKQLKEEDMYTIIRYNSWEDDDYDTPIIPISFKIAETFPNESKKYKQKFLACTKIIGSKIIKNIIEKKLGIGEENVNEIAKFLKNGDIESISDKISGSQISNDYLTDYEMYKKVKNEIREILEKQTENKKIIFLIDELDRCRPLYAISLLETVKHYFNIPNIIFVFALDMDQLKHSIATIYGQNMDSYGYIRRFFKHCIKLPSPNINEYLQHIDNGAFSKDNNFIIEISTLFTDMELTFRDIDVIYSNMLILYYLKFKDNEEYLYQKLIVYSFLISLKYKQPKVYELIINDNFSISSNKIINEKKDKEYYINLSNVNIRKIIDFLYNHLGKTNLMKPNTNYKIRDFISEYININSIAFLNEYTLSSYIQLVMEGIEDMSI